MKKLGLIGGTGPESTAIYYKELNRLIFEKTGAYPELVIESINLNKASGFIQKEDYSSLIDYFSTCIEHLVSSGAEIVALTAGTMHIIYKDLEKLCPVPMVSIPKTVVCVAKQRGYHRIGLLGTIFTMEKEYMKLPFLEKNIEIVVPTKEERELVHTRIFNELELGVVKESTQKEFIQVIRNMMERDSIDAVILGCTELPLALNSGNCPVDSLDVMQLHIEELVEIITK